MSSKSKPAGKNVVKTSKPANKPAPQATIPARPHSRQRDVFGGRVNPGVRGYVINAAIVKLAGPKGTKGFTAAEVQAELDSPANKLAQQYATLAGGPVAALHAHLRGLIFRGFTKDAKGNSVAKTPHLKHDAGTGIYTLAPHIVAALTGRGKKGK